MLVLEISSISQVQFWSNDFWITVTENAIGSLAAIIASFILFYLTVWSDKKRERNNKYQVKLDNMIYLSASIQSIIKITQSMVMNINDTITEIENDNINYYNLKVLSLNELKRITENNELGSYMLSYTSAFKGVSGASEFQKIIENVDYLEYELSQLPTLAENAGKIISEYHQKIHELFLKTRDITRRISESMTDPPDEIITGIFNIAIPFISRSGIRDIQSYYSDYFLPLNEFIVEVIITNKRPEYIALAELTLEGRELHALTIQENNEYQRILAQIGKSLSESLDELQHNSQTLLAIKKD